jgi:hypothetical protein
MEDIIKLAELIYEIVDPYILNHSIHELWKTKIKLFYS